MREREGRRVYRSEDEENKKNLAEGVKKIKAEVSILNMSRRVDDTESSSNGEVALLEELEDEKVPKSCLCLTVVLILDATLWTSGSSMASMATDCRGGMYCLMSCMLFFRSFVLPITSGLATYRFLGPDLLFFVQLKGPPGLRSFEDNCVIESEGYAISYVAAC
ncbi:uncharacterized protein [Triticum aestivum]|uniref:uncharacterized protein isoform X2 n=1 Tax=Triticum aestivum TaxID=4565 RepID=UPI001D017469|nr:uncharacterized protein LOC123061192 isoform X2 [Triticum aestivum]